jgi:HKD family nuclease
MKIEVVTNKIFPINDVLENEIVKCRSFIIGSSFINEESIMILDNLLKKKRSFKNVRILIGVYGNFNRKAALVNLNAIAKKHALNLQVHISKDKNYHWKYYNFQFTNRQSIYVGSANFTSTGMNTNGELLVKLSDVLPAKERGVLRLIKEFEMEWDNSGSIADFNLDEYKERSLPVSKKSEGTTGNNEFFKKKTLKRKQKISTSGKAMIVNLAVDISKLTEKMVLNLRPEWEQCNFFVCDGPNARKVFDQCCAVGQFLIFDNISRKHDITACWAEYMGDQEVKTVDGKYFIAYQVVSKERKLTNQILNELTNEKGIWKLRLNNRKHPLRFKIFGPTQVQNIESVLQLKAKK